MLKKGYSMQPKDELFYDSFPSPLGPLWMVSNREGLCFILRKESESDFLTELPAQAGCISQKDSTRLKRRRQLLTSYFSGKKVSIDEPISWTVGTPFQKRDCWRSKGLQ